MKEPQGQRVAGLLLGLWFIVHQWIVMLPEQLDSALGILMGAGLGLRLVRRLPPGWVAWLCLAGVFAVPFLAGMSLAGFFAGVSAWVAGVFLLQPLNPRRVLRVLLCAVILLAVIVLTADIASIPLIVDVAILLFLAQQSHTPEEASQSLRAILLRALRLVVPVAAVVVPVFWIFPALSNRTEVALAGFSGELNPGDFSEIRPGRQLAFVAHFAEGAKVPGVGDLFWRGSVLNDNHGFRWLAGAGRTRPKGFPCPPAWLYRLAIEPSRPVAPLGMSEELAEQAAPDDAQLDIEVASFNAQASDPPEESDLKLPEILANDPTLRALTGEIFRSPGGTRQRLGELAEFFTMSGFTYTIRPGRVKSITTFLTKTRRGFCEHYAAASANVLRLAGIPARVITGYRGGRWNPWLRTLSIRDSDAHAWVEAWDAESGSWIRFDPTEAVAPDFMLQLATNRDPSRWTWPRTALTYASSLFVQAGEWLSSPARTWLVPGILLAASASFLIWFLRQGGSRRDSLGQALAAMDRCALRLEIPRKAGETPLAWTAKAARLNPAAERILARFSACYEEAAYGISGASAASRSRLREAAAGLRKISALRDQRRPSTPT